MSLGYGDSYEFLKRSIDGRFSFLLTNLVNNTVRQNRGCNFNPLTEQVNSNYENFVLNKKFCGCFRWDPFKTA